MDVVNLSKSRDRLDGWRRTDARTFDFERKPTHGLRLAVLASERVEM
jgi:hypothetical protein